MNTNGKQSVVAQANIAAALKMKVADIDDDIGSAEFGQTVAVIAEEGQIPSEAIVLSKKLQDIMAI